MEKLSPLKETDEVGSISCWSCLKLKTFRLRKSSSNKQRKPKCGFKYDALSYAQNFDDGCWDDDSNDSNQGFSSRYAAPLPKLVEHH
ncbi:hypothetical protein ACHQM5_016850 [Ranunculus cassubicifolius]